MTSPYRRGIQVPPQNVGSISRESSRWIADTESRRIQWNTYGNDVKKEAQFSSRNRFPCLIPAESQNIHSNQQQFFIDDHRKSFSSRTNTVASPIEEGDSALWCTSLN
uniref:Uncharacterized protein n=1 Tax=Heterorhabditis bacteriophora TaxID=37862 RepID=A0A1I7XFG8_HETBA